MDSKDQKDVATCIYGSSSVSTVSVKLQEFYTTDPDSWFLCAEAQFGLCAVCSNDIKYWYVLSAPDMETSTCTVLTVSSAQPGEKYTTLKKFLCKAFSLSRWECVERVLATNDLRDRKPSMLLNHLLYTLGNFGPKMLQHIFIWSLPSYIQDSLTRCDFTNLESLGDWADEIMSRHCRPALSVSNVLDDPLNSDFMD